jgi:hypothetical protein
MGDPAWAHTFSRKKDECLARAKSKLGKGELMGCVWIVDWRDAGAKPEQLLGFKDSDEGLRPTGFLAAGFRKENGIVEPVVTATVTNIKTPKQQKPRIKMKPATPVVTTQTEEYVRPYDVKKAE